MKHNVTKLLGLVAVWALFGCWSKGKDTPEDNKTIAIEASSSEKDLKFCIQNNGDNEVDLKGHTLQIKVTAVEGSDKKKISDGSTSSDDPTIKLDELLKAKGTKVAAKGKTDEVTTYKLDVEPAASKATVYFALKDAKGEDVATKTLICTLTPEQSSVNMKIEGTASDIQGAASITFEIANKESTEVTNLSDYTVEVEIVNQKKTGGAADATQKIELQDKTGNSLAQKATSKLNDVLGVAKLAASEKKAVVANKLVQVTVPANCDAATAQITILLKDKDDKEVDKKTINWTAGGGSGPATLTIEVEEASIKLDAGDAKKYAITFKLKNTDTTNLVAASTLTGLKVQVKDTSGNSIDGGKLDDITLTPPTADIAAGSSVDITSAEITASADDKVPNKTENYQFIVTAGGVASSPVTLKFNSV